MNFLWLLPTIFALLFACASVFLFLSRERAKRKLAHVQAELAGAQAQLGASRELGDERKALREQLDAATASRFKAEKETELMKQRLDDHDLRIKDWQMQREESMQAAKAAILEAGGQMSSKLLEDHKREQETNKKDQEERIKQTTASLLEQVSLITQSVASLKDQTHSTTNKMDTVWRALTSPTGAGQLAEVGLENTLKNLGLEPGRDFMMQYSMTDQDSGSRLRPDAVLFLPQDVVIVVDSKASKFVIELAEAHGGDPAQARENLKRTMTTHLRDLSSKDYTTAVLNSFKSSGHGSKIRMLLNVMYLPSEAALDQLKAADPEFLAKSEKAGIILAGPASLHGLFSLAKMHIAAAKQAENADVIIAGIEGLMESTATVLSHADKIGSGIKTAAEAFNKMASSANQRLLPRMKKLVAMGVKTPKGKPLPPPIMTYDVRRMDDAMLLEQEEPESETPALEHKAGSD